ncbi:MAG: hypothetical protein PHN21_07695, partial [Erysipelotrichaceae bacterium]|nr:hypothetical protein [Erysipelotrichaceae bacterium]
FPDHHYSILDQEEYRRHQSIMQYPLIVKDILSYTINKLGEMIDNNKEPFNEEHVYHYYQKYLNWLDQRL